LLKFSPVPDPTKSSRFLIIRAQNTEYDKKKTTSPKKTMSGFMTGTLVKGDVEDDADDAPTSSPGMGEPRCCEAEGGAGKGSDGSSSSASLGGFGWTEEEAEERPSSDMIEASSRLVAAVVGSVFLEVDGDGGGDDGPSVFSTADSFGLARSDRMR
jgi:hypothetical protein